MTDLFGIDIAGLVNDSMEEAGGLRPAILTKSVSGRRSTTLPASGNKPEPIEHTCSAFEDQSEDSVQGTSVRRGGRFVSILGASIDPPTTPKKNDTITIDGTTYMITGVPAIDPARALYKCAVEV